MAAAGPATLPASDAGSNVDRRRRGRHGGDGHTLDRWRHWLDGPGRGLDGLGCRRDRLDGRGLRVDWGDGPQVDRFARPRSLPYPRARRRFSGERDVLRPCARRGAGCPPWRPVRLGISPRATRSPLALERGPLRAAAPTPRRKRARPRPVRSPLRPATRHGEPACPPGDGPPSPARPHPVTCPRSKARSRSAATRCPRFDYGVGAAVARRARSPVGGADRPSSADRRSRPEDPAAATPPREGH